MRPDVADDMQRILDLHWRLNDHGYGLVLDCGPNAQGFYSDPTEEQIETERLKCRASMLRPIDLQAFAAARVWLRQWPQRKTFRIGSYWLKHAAEPEIGYTSEGVFIAAVLAEGFQIKAEPWPCCTGVLINIDRRAGRMGTATWDGSYARQKLLASSFRRESVTHG